MKKFYSIVLMFALSCQSVVFGNNLNGNNEYKHKKVISIDLDGVLNNYRGNYDKNNIPEIKSGAKEFVIKLSEKYDLILFTTRNSKQARNWLVKNDLNKYFKEVTNIKKPCYLYIDDRALKFEGDYDKISEEIENYKVYRKGL